MKNYYIPISIVIAGLIIAGAIFLSQGARPPAEDITEQEGITEQPEIVIDLDNWPSLGDINAPVVMVEYSDFACPFCARFWQETLPSIKRDYIDTGKVRFVYKDLIVVGGDRAAEAAHCADEQGKFWEYHDLLLERQAQDRPRWSDSQVHRGYGQELGLDVEALVKCFDERRYQEKVIASTQEAQANGGTGTPYFLINNQSVSGAQPYSVFQENIDIALQAPK